MDFITPEQVAMIKEVLHNATNTFHKTAIHYFKARPANSRYGEHPIEWDTIYMNVLPVWDTENDIANTKQGDRVRSEVHNTDQYAGFGCVRVG